MDHGNISVPGTSIYFFSRALFTNFYMIEGTGLLFDCGEGTALILDKKILRVSDIFISHHHIDHFGGLMALVLLRDTLKGGTKKPLRVYYPKNNGFIKLWIDYFISLNLGLQYKISLIGMEDYSEVFINKKQFVKSYPVVHDDHCLSYCIFEKTTKLNAKYKGLPNIRELRKVLDYHALFKNTVNCKLYYSGDLYNFNCHIPYNIDIGIFDATFLYKHDRRTNTHVSIEELMHFISKRRLNILLLTHISQRYKMEKLLSFFKSIKINHTKTHLIVDNRSVHLKADTMEGEVNED